MKIKNLLKSVKAFTLIELLVVVLIISILAAIAVPKYQMAVLKSRYLQAMTIADSIWRAQQIYYLANGTYTDDIDNLDITLPPFTSKSGKATVFYPWGRCTIDNDYVKEVLCSIKNNSRILYIRNYSYKEKICIAKETDALATNLCTKQLGGKYRGAHNSAGKYYTLP